MGEQNSIGRGHRVCNAPLHYPADELQLKPPRTKNIDACAWIDIYCHHVLGCTTTCPPAVRPCTSSWKRMGHASRVCVTHQCCRRARTVCTRVQHTPYGPTKSAWTIAEIVAPGAHRHTLVARSSAALIYSTLRWHRGSADAAVSSCHLERFRCFSGARYTRHRGNLMNG